MGDVRDLLKTPPCCPGSAVRYALQHRCTCPACNELTVDGGEGGGGEGGEGGGGGGDGSATHTG